MVLGHFVNMTFHQPLKKKAYFTCGLYYQHMTIANDDPSVVNKLGASLTDNARVFIYDRHMFIVQATDLANAFVLWVTKLMQLW